MRFGVRGTFDSFNGWIDKGAPIASIVNETLMVASADEPFTRYCLLCRAIEYPADPTDRTWLVFHLREQARWHDGRRISPQDVVWSFNTLVAHGRPFYRFYYADVARVYAVGEHAVRFEFKPTGNRELPLIIGDLPILPQHYWDDPAHDITKTTLTPPLGSGPYQLTTFDAGRSYELTRVADYWGADLAVQRGLHNFNTLRYDYFRDRIPIRLALKAGEIDYYAENTAKSWATEFDLPVIAKGWLVKEKVDHSAPQGMQAFVMNLRREKFQDRNIRQAIALAFDFNWLNQNIFYGQYRRSRSFFSNSDLSATGAPSADEVALLAPFRAQLPARLFTEPFELPTTDGSGWARDNLKQALALIDDSDWQIVDGKLHDPHGRPLRIEFLLYSNSFERLVLPYVANLARLGIDMRVRVVDSGQYINRLRAFDFDMIVGGWGQSETPGNEQRDFWSCAAAARAGSRNTAGLCSPVIDALVEKLIVAADRAALITAVSALDRVLLWQHFVVPNWHLPADRILWWHKFSRPARPLRHGVNIARWWYDAAKAQQLADARTNGTTLKGATR